MGKIFSKDKPSSTGAYDSLEDIVLTPNLLEHPLFLRSDDELLSTFIESLKCVVRPSQDTAGLHRQNKRFEECFVKIKFDPTDFKKLNSSNFSSCGKVIPTQDIYFRCLDCEICEEATTSLQCQDCFVNSNHYGHRILKCKPTEGIIYTCDCGRIDFIKAEAFCSKHKYKEQTLEEALTDFPKTAFTQVLEIFKKALYGVVCLFEISASATNKRVKLLIDSLGQSYVQKILNYYNKSCTDITKSFILVFESLMQTTFDAPNNLLWHNCEDFSDQDHNKGTDNKQAHPCTCSILGNLLRYSRDYNPNDQGDITKLLIECSREKRFQPFLIKEMLRYSKYIFANPTVDDDDPSQKNSKMIELLQKVMTPEEAEIQYLGFLMDTLNRAIKYYSKAVTPNCEAIVQIGCGIAYFLGKESKPGDKVSHAGEKVLLETNLMNEFLELLYAFQIKVLYPLDIKLGLFEHNVDYPHFDQTLTGEKFLFMSIEHGLKKIEGFPAEKKLDLFKNITRSWMAHFENAKMAQDHQRLFEGKVNYLSGLEKILCPLILTYVDEISKEKVEKFVREFFPNIFPTSLAANAVGGSLNTLGIMRYTDILRKTEPEAFKSYYYTAFGIFEIDLVFLQLMTLIIKPEDLFSVFSKNFFSYSQDLQYYCTSGLSEVILHHPNSKQMLLLLEDYLKFYIYLMNDEMCITNLNLREQLNKTGPDFPPERVIKRVLVNMLMNKPWVDVSLVKMIFGGLILDGVRVPTDATISKITLKDQETHKIKLKEEYESELDPYMFYKLYYFQRDEQNLLTTNVKHDLVSGQYYTDLPEYLKTIQQNVFQSDLPDFLAQILNNFTPELTHLLHPTLKLVLLNLQVMIDLLDNFADNIEGIQNKVKKNYLNREFSKKLTNILAQGDFKECEACIKKIQDLIKDLQSRFFLRQASVDPNAGHAEESLMEQKKRQAKEKMERLKEEFAKKQALFAEKNETLLVQASTHESPEIKKENEQADEKEVLCQYCLDKIDITTDEYGLPVYIEFTNNFYDTKDYFTSQPKPLVDFSTSKWWPVISSCNHFYHQKCFNMHFASSRGPQNEASQMYNNEYETQCALCKTLCNNFLCMNKTVKTSGDNENVPQQKYSNENSINFTLKTQNLLYNLGEKLVQLINPQQNTNPADGVTLKEFFKRTYQYFTESFYLYDKPHSLEEAFRLHVNCFKSINENIRIEGLKPEAMLEFDLKDGGDKYQETDIKINFFNLVQGKLLEKSEQESPLDGFLMKEHVAAFNNFLATTFLTFIYDYERDKREENDEESDEDNPLPELEELYAKYKEDQEMRSRYFEAMSFSLQKIVFIYYLNKCVTTNEDYTNSEVLKMLCGANLNKEDLELLLKKLEISSDPLDELVDKSIKEAFEANPEEVALFKAGIKTTRQQARSLKMAPHHIEIPEAYTEFNSTYIHSKCKVCNKFNQYLLLNVCMICGEVLCSLGCEQVNAPRPGNLSVHAARHHMGSSLYFGVDHHGITLIKIPLGLVFDLRGVYIDEIGQNFQHASVRQAFDPQEIPRSLDFSKFYLDPKAMKLMVDIINRHSEGKEIFDRAPVNPQGFADANRM